MAKRKVILANGETYHIFNRSVRQTPIFTNRHELRLFLKAARYYLQTKPLVKFSVFRQSPAKYKPDFSRTLVKVVAYCLMPNHYHFILSQVEDKGIETFIHRLATSYSCYFNLKNKQRGPVFESNFKAVRVESQEQLIHLSRYLHLNPVTGYLIEDPKDYEFSSYNDYLDESKKTTEERPFLDKGEVMTDFSSVESYRKFVLDQKDYQRELDRLKHLILE